MLLRPVRHAAWIPLLLYSFASPSFSLFVDEGMERKKASKFIKAREKGVEAFCGDL